MAGLNLGNVAFVGSLRGVAAAPAATNRALVTVDGSQGLLPSNRATGFNLGSSWRLKVRVRQTTANGRYVLGTAPDSAGSLALIWNFNAGQYEMFGNGNRFGLTALVTDALFHTVEFVYGSGVISGFLDGVAAGSQASATFTSSVPASTPLGIGNVAGNSAFLGAYDSVLLEIDGQTVVDLSFNEADGAATNAGTNGGVMAFTGGVSREIAA